MRAKPIQYALIMACILAYLCFFSTPSQADNFEKNTSYAVCFSPNNNCSKTITTLIDHAKHRIDLASYSFTSWPISKALLRAHSRGISIRIITDKSQFKNKSLIPTLMHYDIPVWVDDTVSIAHNKYLIVDGLFVETGSFNYTTSANRYNAENLLIIQSSKLAHDYENNFAKRLSLSVPAEHYYYHPTPYYTNRKKTHHGHHH